MADLAPPVSDDLPITPNTRSAAEEAMYFNTLTQTVSAGQAPPTSDSHGPPSPVTGRPPFPTRTSTNYVDAATSATLEKTPSRPIASPPNLAPRPKGLQMPVSPSEEDLAAQNEAAEAALFAEQAAAKRTSVDMRSDSIAGIGGSDVNGGPTKLGARGRQQSWSKEDMKRMMQEPLMEGRGDGQGYSGKGGSVTGY